MADVLLSTDRQTPAQPQTENGRSAGTPLTDIRFLTVPEVAASLRVSKMTVYRLLHSGELESIRVGRSFRVPEYSLSKYFRTALYTETSAVPAAGIGR